jgi:hypothetical protein
MVKLLAYSSIRKYLSIPLEGFSCRLAAFLALVVTLISEQQIPLTGNQHVYLIKPIFNNGAGTLALDWQVNTIDMMPVFTLLTSAAVALFGDISFTGLSYIATFIFYLSLFLIAARTIDYPEKRTILILFFCFLIIVSSSALFNGHKIFLQGFANQYLVKGYFQPSSAGTLLLLSVALFLCERKLLSIISLGLAATIHPTYLLPAGMLTMSFMVSDYIQNRSGGSAIKLGVFATLLVAPIAIVTAMNFNGNDAALIAQGQNLMANFREPHHAHIENWRLSHSLLQLTVLASGIWLSRHTRLFPILVIPSAIAILIMALKAVTGSDFLALLFPHRISTCLIPIASSIIFISLATKLSHLKASTSSYLLVGIVVITLITVWGSITQKSTTDLDKYFEKHAIQDGYNLIEKVKNTRLLNTVYIVPTDMYWFRLETLTPVVVDWKSHPYTPIEMVEWYERYTDINAIYQPMLNNNALCTSISDVAKKYAATNIIYPNKIPLTGCGYTRVFTGGAFSIYHINIDDDK